MKLNKIYNEDCLTGMKKLDDNSVDCIVTDPPYQLDSITKRFGKEDSAKCQYGKDGSFQRLSKGFMGKEWDVLPKIEIWKECLRVLKDGAFMFILMTPRQDSHYRCLRDLDDAGFIISFSPIFWTYASGFPKALNIGKMVDKHKRRDYVLAAKDLGIKPVSTASWRDWTVGEHSPSNKYLDEFKRVISKEDWEKIERKVIAKKEKLNTFSEVGYSSGEGTFEKTEIDITVPATPQAKALDGSYGGFQPKPAVEVIIVAMKPLSEKTYVDQALKNKKGITWLDDARIPYDDATAPKERIQKDTHIRMGEGSSTWQWSEQKNKPHKLDYIPDNQQGRFPANLLVSDDVLNDGKNYKSGSIDDVGKGFGNSDIFGKGTDVRRFSKANEGSFSRYFDLDKWAQKTFPFLIVPKASKGEKNEGLDEMEEGFATEQNKWIENDYRKGKGEKTSNPKKNYHPTVKPVKLMSYLITLGSREGDVILDPFIGSGTTAISARILNRKFIGFEKEKEYHKIAEERVKEYLKQRKLFEEGDDEK